MMIDFILHLFGACTDSHIHIDLTDLIVFNEQFIILFDYVKLFFRIK